MNHKFIDLNNILEQIKRIEARIVPIASGLYGMGLLSWMCYSWRHNLGHVEAFNSQYFITGIIPSLTILYFYWIIKNLPQIRKRALAWLHAHVYVLRLLRLLTSLALLLFLFELFFEIPSLIPLTAISQLPIWLSAFLLFLMFNVLLIIYPALFQNRFEKGAKAENEGRTPFQLMMEAWTGLKDIYLSFFKYLLWPYFFAASWILIMYYFENFYPNLPQEIGGIKPKKAIFITQRSSFSANDQIEISVDSMASAKTDTLLIYFYNDSKFILKLCKEVKTKGSKAQAFEIARTSIKSVKWLN